MACDKETLVLISVYADGEANLVESAKAEAHLGKCSECRELIEEWRGQLSVLEWAYSGEIPVECSVEEIQRLAGRHTTMRRSFGTSDLSKIFVQPNWSRLGAVAALVAVLALGIHYFATRPVALQINHSVASSNQIRTAIIGPDISLRVGPGSEITRIDDKSIHLNKGWVDASVRHGTGFQILTDRMKITDQGTEFEVGTGQKLDYVIVRKGSVSVAGRNWVHEVNADHVLVDQEARKTSVASLPMDDINVIPDDPLGKQSFPFVINYSGNILWREGLKRLASRFPDARLHDDGEMLGGGFQFKCAKDSRLRPGVYEHFEEIAQAISGNKAGSRNWEIPVGVLQVEGDLTEHPGITGDVFFVRLISQNGKLVWRLTGSKGAEFDVPVAIENPDISPEDWGSISGTMGSMGYSSGKDETGNHTVIIYLADWPGELKPVLKLNMRVPPVPQRVIESRDLHARIKSTVDGIEGFKSVIYPNFELTYINPEMKHPFAVVWNYNAREQLCRITDLSKQGKGGSALLAAVWTDVPLEEPAAGPGTYLLRFVLADGSTTPHLELVTPDLKPVGRSSALPIPKNVKMTESMDNMMWPQEANLRPDYALVLPSWGVASAKGDEYPIRFYVVGRPDGNLTYNKINKYGVSSTEHVWTEGWIKVKKP